MELYKISFPHHLTTKVYIGISSKSAKARFKEHCASLKNYPICMALRKFGASNAILEVLATFDNFDDLYRAEQEAIKAFGSKAPNGYNLTDGGKGTYGLPASEERKRKISDANRGRKPSAETRKKISEANKKRDLSAQVEAMAKANKGRKKSPEVVERMGKFWMGRKHTDASKEKMSKSASMRVVSDETRNAISAGIKAKNGGKVFSFSSPDGLRVDVSNMTAFCRAHGLSKPHMYNVASGVELAHKGWVKCIN